MKYIISENQYKILLKEDRVTFLKNQNVIDPKILDQSVEGEDEKDGEREPGGMKPKKFIVEPIENHEGIDIAYIVTKKNKQSIKLTDLIFEDIVDADPSSNKQYVQWMIKVFMTHIKEGEIEQAIRFLSEDLPEANEFLEVFDKVKNKKVFKRSAPNRPNAPQNVTDINQYSTLAQLYSVVSPFVGMGDDDDDDDDGESKLWKKLKKYIDLGEAKLAYRDNDVLVYMPQTIESSCEPLGPLASWCTRREGNSYFDSYRQRKKPDGSLSDYYVVMPKKLFDGDDEGGVFPLQIHFESNQWHDKNNSSIERNGKLQEILKRFPGLNNFLKDELGALVEMDARGGKGLMDSSYVKYLNMVGGKASDHISPEAFEEGVANIRKLAGEQNVPLQQNKYLKWLMENTDGVVVTDFLDPETTDRLDFSGMNIGTIPDLTKFTNLDAILAEGSNITEMPSIDKLPMTAPLTMLSFQNNDITEAPPKGYEKLPNLFSINLKGNPISKINVDVVEKLLDLDDFIRLAIDDDRIEALPPKNKKEYQDLIGGSLGSLITSR
jgi:hypothetical protein